MMSPATLRNESAATIPIIGTTVPNTPCPVAAMLWIRSTTPREVAKKTIAIVPGGSEFVTVAYAITNGSATATSIAHRPTTNHKCHLHGANSAAMLRVTTPSAKTQTHNATNRTRTSRGIVSAGNARAI